MSFREVKAIYLVLCQYCDILSTLKIKIFSDNSGAIAILHKGSPVPELNNLSKQIYSLCVKKQIIYEGQWIPRTLNDQAHFLSKCYDPDDFKLNPVLFQMLTNVFGNFSIDHFADDNNYQLPVFNSKWFSKHAIAFDAFSQDWSGHNNYCFPPPNLIINTLKHMEFCKAKGCILVSEWIGHKCWPLLTHKNAYFNKFVKNKWFLPKM